jgi:hypothetical protein
VFTFLPIPGECLRIEHTIYVNKNDEHGSGSGFQAAGTLIGVTYMYIAPYIRPFVVPILNMNTMLNTTRIMPKELLSGSSFAMRAMANIIRVAPKNIPRTTAPVNIIIVFY